MNTATLKHVIFSKEKEEKSLHGVDKAKKDHHLHAPKQDRNVYKDSYILDHPDILMKNGVH